MPAPQNLYGTIKFRTTADTRDLPKFGITGSSSLRWLSSGKSEEMFVKQPQFLPNPYPGLTANNISYIYLNNYFDFASGYLYEEPIASAFAPNFYIDSGNEPKIAWTYTTQGSVDFTSAPNNGVTEDRFEVFYLKYTTNSFLTAAGGGATANAITGITFAHEILPGNTTLSAQQIYYRKIGNISYPESPEE
jgi:hypothetical protein